jgi:CBS domain-containing protein
MTSGGPWHYTGPMKTPTKTTMTRHLITLPAGTPLPEAQALMQEKRIRHIPIVDRNSDIVGILSDRDVTAQRGLPGLLVEHAMNNHVEFMNQDVPLRSTILRMLEKHLSAILISDELQECVGIVTTEDLLWYLAHSLEKETDRSTWKSLLDIQTLNQAATQISNAGI